MTGYLVPEKNFGHPCQAIFTDLLTEKRRRCGIVDANKPMAFRGTPWCSENHRKLVQGE